MFVTAYKPLTVNFKPLSDKLKQENNKIVSNNNFVPVNSCDVYFSANKREIIGKVVAKTKIKKIISDKLIKDLDTIVALNISYEERGRQKIQYRLYTQDKKLLGHIRMDDTKVNSFVYFNPYYGNDQQKAKYIYVTYLESIDDKAYKGVGQKLIQLAIEQSIQNGHGGKVALCSEKLGNSDLRELPSSYGCPTGFYYEKCHFRSNPDDFRGCSGEPSDNNIEQELKRVRAEGKHPSEANLNHIDMHLPEEEIREFWLPKIKENPIILSKDKIKEFEKSLAKEH